MKRLLGETFDGEADHGGMDEGFVVAGFAFVVTCQAAGFHEPAEGVFHDPTPSQQLKAFRLIAAFDDFQGKAAVSEEGSHLPHPGLQFPLITAVGEDQGHAQKPMAEQTQKHLGPIPVLNAGRPDVNPEKQALGIGQEMAFAAFDFLARIVAAAAGPDGVGAFDALAVDNGRTGLGVFLV